MTIIVQFENNNGYAQGVAIMPEDIYSHPIMIEALERLAHAFGFDREVGFSRDQCYQSLHDSVDSSRPS